MYRLTEKGIELAPLMIELALWGAKYVPDNAAPAATIHQMRTAREKVVGQLRASLLRELRSSSEAK